MPEKYFNSTVQPAIDFISLIENEKKGSNDIVLPQVANIGIQTDQIKVKKNDFGTRTEFLPEYLSSQVDFQI